jgi:hypothetical protein
MAIIYHIYHKERDKSSVQRNREIEESTKVSKRILTKSVDQYL